MNKPETQPPRLPSLADYLLRYDLQTMIEEAKLDYNQTSSGAPRLLNQKDISARFRRNTPPPQAGKEPPHGPR